MNLFLLLSLFVFKSIFFFYYKDEPKFETNRIKFIENYRNYQAEKDLGMKTFSLDISNNGFLRYKRTGTNNRVEYFSVRLDKISKIDYLGSENAGWMVFKCEKESVIFQTYRDAKGDVDNMIDEFKFPVKDITLQKINDWDFNVKEMKSAFSNTQK